MIIIPVVKQPTSPESCFHDRRQCWVMKDGPSVVEATLELELGYRDAACRCAACLVPARSCGESHCSLEVRVADELEELRLGFVWRLQHHDHPVCLLWRKNNRSASGSKTCSCEPCRWRRAGIHCRYGFLPGRQWSG